MKAMQNLMLVAVMMLGTAALAQGRLVCPAGSKVNTLVDSTVVFENCVSTTSGMCEGTYRGTYKTGGNQTLGQCKSGMRTGHWTYFDPQGKKQAEIDFEAGDYHGTRVEYFANGQKKFEETYDHGRMTAQTKFDEKPAAVVPATVKK